MASAVQVYGAQAVAPFQDFLRRSCFALAFIGFAATCRR
ncbi:hypothetical protein U91I_01033 [alpha proteobacterium U9-1i]|nr:hypothetical protein U91I_01033 [alpha proteobacterium U9-1i]